MHWAAKDQYLRNDIIKETLDDLGWALLNTNGKHITYWKHDSTCVKLNTWNGTLTIKGVIVINYRNGLIVFKTIHRGYSLYDPDFSKKLPQKEYLTYCSIYSLLKNTGMVK